MARWPKIKTRAWVHKGGELVNVDTLTPEERMELGTWIRLTILNTVYAGRATFFVAEDTKEEHANEDMSMPEVPGGGVCGG